MSSATSNNSTSSFIPPRRMIENQGSSNASVAQSPRRPSRWTQIVRGDQKPIASTAMAGPSSPQSRTPIELIASVSVATPPDSLSTVNTAAADDEKSEESCSQGDAGKKPVWKKTSNGASEVGPVMGASSWPALSDSTKAPSNKSSSDSLKCLCDVPSSSSSSIPVSQGIANASVPARKLAGRANPNLTPNHSRQRSFKRHDASQPSDHGPFAELPSHNPSPKGLIKKSSASQTRPDSYRNQNGNHHQTHSSRRNQEHGNENRTFHRSFNGREGNVDSQRGTPAFVRHTPPPVQQFPPHFMAAQPIRPFGSSVTFPTELGSPYYPRMPFITPLAPPPVFFHVQEPPLHIRLQHQIHYYFSEQNLIRDMYLRGLMDEQGFVSLRVIAGFKRVAALTDNVQQIVEALQGSPNVEVQGDLIRRRHDWQNWLLRKTRSPAVSSPKSVHRSDTVVNQLENLSRGQSSGDSIGGSNSQMQPAQALSDGQQQSSGDDDAPVTNHNDSYGANH